jgi:hypothetical protein
MPEAVCVPCQQPVSDRQFATWWPAHAWCKAGTSVVEYELDRFARLFRGPSPYCYLSGGHGLKAPRNVVTVHAEEGTGFAYWDLPGVVFGTASRSPAEEAPALNAGQRAFESRREDQ